VPAVFDITATQMFTALAAFLDSVLPAGVESYQTQVNRVPEPLSPDFVMMTPMRQERLSWNQTSYVDNIITGSITGTVLTVTAVGQSQGAGLVPGLVLTDGSFPNLVAAGTTITAQLSGAPGGIGTYTVSVSQTLASETLFAGQRQDLVPTKWTVQLDVYGPGSNENVKMIEGLFYSSVATDFFTALGLPLQVLSTDEARQTPLISGEEQYQQRWTLNVDLQFNPTIGTPIQFFDEAEVAVVEAALQYTGP